MVGEIAPQFWALVAQQTFVPLWSANVFVVVVIGALALIRSMLPRLHQCGPRERWVIAALLALALVLCLPAAGLNGWTRTALLGLDLEQLDPAQISTETFTVVAYEFNLAISMGLIGCLIFMVAWHLHRHPETLRRSGSAPVVQATASAPLRAQPAGDPSAQSDALLQPAPSPPSSLTSASLSPFPLIPARFAAPVHDEDEEPTEYQFTGDSRSLTVPHIVVVRPLDVDPSVYPIAGTEFVIGRHRDKSHLGITDKQISREHARIQYDAQQGWCLTNYSPNGTRVNGRFINEKTTETLHHDDRISLGLILLRFAVPAESEDTAITPIPDERRAVLFVLDRNGNLNWIFPLTTRETGIGRDPQNELVLPERTVSRRHARLCFDGWDYQLNDVSSGTDGAKESNGTYLEKTRITGPTPVQHGQTIRLGDQYLRFEFEDAPDDTLA